MNRSMFYVGNGKIEVIDDFDQLEMTLDELPDIKDDSYYEQMNHQILNGDES